jgi:CRP-like cAMP-binding protein
MVVESSLPESLARLALFADLDRAELTTLAGMAEEASFGEGEWILRRGQENVSLHVIVDGEAGVVLEDEELAVLPPGGFFGEISALLAEPAVADIVARTHVQCLVVRAADLESFLLAHPRVMLRMLQAEARRLKTADESRG